MTTMLARRVDTRICVLPTHHVARDGGDPHRQEKGHLVTYGRTDRRWRVIVGLLAVAAVLGLAACGDDAGSDPAIPGSDAGDDVTTETGNDNGDPDGSDGQSNDGGTVDVGGGDFAIPAPEGLVLDALVDSGLDMEGQRQLYYENDDFDRVVAFYDDWTSQNGEWTRGEAEGIVTFQSLDGDSLRWITITPDHDPGAQADGPVTYVLLVADG
jgi:hypothetical protein